MNSLKPIRRFYQKLVFFTSDNRYHKGVLNNISLNGAFIETQDKFYNGQDLAVFLPGSKLGKGAVIYCEVSSIAPKGIELKFKKNVQGKIVQYV